MMPPDRPPPEAGRLAMPAIALILARTVNHVIGRDNRLPWRLRSDLRRFRKLTLHHAVIMGWRTFQSIGKPLDSRKNIILSRNPSLRVEGACVCPDIASALLAADRYSLAHGLDTCFVIGGETVFTALAPDAERVHLTEIHATLDGDAVLSLAFTPPDWTVLSETHVPSSADDEFDYDYKVIQRTTPRVRTRSAGDIISTTGC